MPILRSSCFTLACATLLVACAQPRTATPMVDAQDVYQERQKQSSNAKGFKSDVDYDAMEFSKADQKQMEQRLQGVVHQLAPEATKLCRELNGPEADCNMRIELDLQGKGLNAFADGTRIVVFAPMMAFTEGKDDQLAFILAHEYTHHMMDHVGSAKKNVITGSLLGLIVDVAAASQGMSTQGQFSKAGAQAGRLNYSPSFEQEADYIALYMLERAGFNTQNAPKFWRRMSQYNPQGIYNRTTHPTTPERFIMMERTIEEIEMKKRSGQRLLPNLQPET